MHAAIRRDVTDFIGKLVRRVTRAPVDDLLKVHRAAMVRRANLAALRRLRAAAG